MSAWYVCLLRPLSGALLANGVPHFVQGVRGNRFPTPFASPPGVGESSPLINVVWGLANLVGGALLLARFAPDDPMGWMPVAAGALLAAVWLWRYFAKLRAVVPTRTDR